MKTVIDYLKERKFLEAVTSDELHTLTRTPVTVYAGFDPTADSLHLGNMVAIMGLAWFQKFGHRPIAIIGGATGMVGDPCGKNSERPLLDFETIQKNLAGIKKNLERFLDFSHPTAPAMILNNYDWMKNFSYLDFLRDIGRHFRMGPMLAKDSVRARLESKEGMSYTEFSYQLLQAYDFYYLNEHYGATIQLGGSDQWGNITAGTELIRRLTGKQAYGLIFPLLTRSDGKKFGKSESGAIWLAGEKLSAYEFYQYAYRIPDADVIEMMRMLTFMDLEEIKGYQEAMKSPEYRPNTAQKRLAEELTQLVHGADGLAIAQKVTAAAQPGHLQDRMDAQMLEAVAQDMPSKTLPLQQVVDKKIPDLLAELELAPSKGEARRLIRGGGVYVNQQKVEDEMGAIQNKDLIEGKLLLLAIGKKKKILLRVTTA